MQNIRLLRFSRLCRALGSVLAAAAVLGGLTAAEAASYSVSPAGDDAAAGTVAHPWKTLAKVNATHLNPGDRVLLASGATFPGCLVLNDTEAGTPGKPLVIGTTGKQRATISSGAQTAISAAGGGITIQNLILKGAATKPDKTHGIEFYTEDKQGKKQRAIRISQVEITGFGDDALSIGSGGAAGYEDVRITHVNIHDNFGTGIITSGTVSTNPVRYSHRNFFVSDCTVARSHSGSGIIISGVDHAVVEFCRASDCDGNGGGVGIWAYATRDVTFRYCISSGTSAHNGGDGGGFDLDGACVGCVVQSCLAYGSEGPGYMHCDYPWASATSGNVIESSVSVNDGRKPKGSSYGFGFCVWGAGLDNCVIRDNLTLVTVDDTQAHREGAYWVSYIPESAKDLANDHDRQHMSGCVFRGNVAIVTGSGIEYTDVDWPEATPANVQFQGNVYRARPGLAPTFGQGEAHFATLKEWQAATGQETSPGSVDPTRLADLRPGLAASLSRITDPRVLPTLSVLKRQ